VLWRERPSVTTVKPRVELLASQAIDRQTVGLSIVRIVGILVMRGSRDGVYRENQNWRGGRI
jgi:hypothetical protein